MGHKIALDRIQDLEVFVQVVERGSMTAAGVTLGLSTPLVSRRLAALERQLGVRLVDRSSRLLNLTSEGREFFARASNLLEQLRDAEAALHAKPGELRGTLRVSVPSAAVEMGLIADFGALCRRHAQLNVEVTLSDRPQDVVGRGLDAALFLTDAPDRHPGSLVLGQHPTSLAAAPEYLERAGRPQTPQDLLKHRTIRAVSRRGTPSAWQLIDDAGREVEIPATDPMILSDDLRVTYAAVTAGAGIARMPLGHIARASKRGQLELVMPDWRFRPIMLMCTLRRRGAASNKVQALLELVDVALRRIDDFAAGSPLEAYYRARTAAAVPLKAASSA
jgi:DNA-binding transcriptional LysR family regulator